MSNIMQEHTFGELPKIKIERSRFPMTQGILTTFNTGDIVPFFVEKDVIPGDTFRYSCSLVLRGSTPKKPVMDNAFLDLYFWFTPYRICQDHFRNVMGENTETAWTQQTEYVVPQLISPAGGYKVGTVANYMGIRLNTAGIRFSALPIRAYNIIYNEWYRNQNVIAPKTMYKDDVDRTGSITDPELGGQVYKAAKLPDYFTRCLPSAQKGAPVTIPIGEFAQVWGYDQSHASQAFPGHSLSQVQSVYMRPISAATATFTPYPLKARYQGIEANSATYAGFGNNNTQIWTSVSNDNVRFLTKAEGTGPGSANTTGLYTDLTTAVAATVNSLRLAIQTQKMLETDARNGTRFREVILGHFGVYNDAERMQISEYLGGKRIPITQNQIAQTSSSDVTSPQGNLAAFSQTVDVSEIFTKSFTEWGCIIGIAIVRTCNSYAQGLDRGWSRRRRYDFYDPKFANLGEMDVLNKEIFVTGNDNIDNQRFGCQEAWADLRYKQNLVTGEFSPDYEQSLDVWHYGSDFANTPTLSQSFVEETTANVDRTLAVQSSVSHQWLLNGEIQIDATRPMPLYSVPGLADHH